MSLDDMREVFSALAQAETGIRSGKAPGTSGTAQIGGGYDPALSASSIASRMRSVNRGQMSGQIALVDLAATWIRRRSADMQKGAIQNLTDAVINDPRLAADLLSEYNPATYAAKRAMIFQKYGVRANQVLNVLDEVHGEEGDPVVAAVKRGR